MRASLASRSLAAFPVSTAGRPPHQSFRGLLGVHLVAACVLAESPNGDPFASECFSPCRYLHEPLRLLPAGTTVCRAGFAPAGGQCLSTAHGDIQFDQHTPFQQPDFQYQFARGGAYYPGGQREPLPAHAAAGPAWIEVRVLGERGPAACRYGWHGRGDLTSSSCRPPRPGPRGVSRSRCAAARRHLDSLTAAPPCRGRASYAKAGGVGSTSDPGRAPPEESVRQSAPVMHVAMLAVLGRPPHSAIEQSPSRQPGCKQSSLALDPWPPLRLSARLGGLS